MVIGAGVQGLTTGVVLAEQGWRVRIRTAEAPEHSAAAAAGAMWGPAMLSPREEVLEWVTRSYHEFVALAENPATGVHLAAGTMAARVDLGDVVPPEARLIPDLRPCEPAELPSGFVSGYHATVPLMDMPRYLDYLVDRFAAAGGALGLSPVLSLVEAADDSRIVINCSGVGAHELVGDPGVRPVRGQSVVVTNPGVTEYFIEFGTEGDTIGVMPHGDRVVLGGVALEQDWNREPDPETTAGILRRCARVDPRLAEAAVLEERVGLRPGRASVRVSAEEYVGSRIVHNYGHAGSGVALSWGCAYAVAALVAQ